MSSPLPYTSESEALEQAATHERNGDFDAALKIYLTLAQNDPEALDSKYRAGTALMRRGDLDDAVTLLRQVVFAAPDHLPARTNLGNALLLLGQSEPARDAFVAVLDLDPGNRNALFGLATILIRLGDPGRALPLTARLLQVLPDSAAALTLDADARAPHGDTAGAIAQYRHALRVDPQYLPALKGLADTLYHQNRLQEAEAYARRAIERQKDDPELLALLGAILMAREDWPAAVEALGAAFDRDSNNPAPLVQMSLACRRSGDLAGAIHHAQRAWTLAPTDKSAGNALGAALAAAGEAKGARDVLMAGGDRSRLPAHLWSGLGALQARLLEDEARVREEALQAAAAATLDPEYSTPEQAEQDIPTAKPAQAQEDGRRQSTWESTGEPETLPLFPED